MKVKRKDGTVLNIDPIKKIFTSPANVAAGIVKDMIRESENEEYTRAELHLLFHKNIKFAKKKIEEGVDVEKNQEFVTIAEEIYLQIIEG